MANKNKYFKVYGCPKHGTHYGSNVVSKKKMPTDNEWQGYLCKNCKKVYIENPSIPQGDTKKLRTYKGVELKVWNTIGPIRLPKDIIVYDKQKGLASCICGKNKPKLKTITHFLLPNGDAVVANGVKLCKTCGKAYITAGAIKNLKKLLDNYKVNIEYADNMTSVDDTAGKTVEEQHICNTLQENVDWKSACTDGATEELEISTVEGLKPANMVASAYYDANISYNPYQYLPWLKMHVNGARNLLISDEVGLGKTIEAGILIHEELTKNVDSRILVVCPAFLREKWNTELREKFLLSPQIYDGKNEIDNSTNIVILPISRLNKFLEDDLACNFDLIIVDEVHYFKNASSKRYYYLSTILQNLRNAKYVFMSATPINNSGNDYISIRRLFGDNPDKTNTTKKQAYIYLPKRNISDIYVDLTPEEQDIYNVTDELDPFSGTIYRHIGSSCLYALTRYAFSGSEKISETKDELRASLEILLDGMELPDEMDCFTEKMNSIKLPDSDTKLEKLIDLIDSHENNSKIVLFTHYIETVKYLQSALNDKYQVGYIYANNISHNIPCKNAKNKFEDAKRWFSEMRADKVILICSDSCREGIDLDVANVLINYDLPFNPSILEQRIGRIDRMSQKRNMTIYNFHVNDTYDDRLHFILNTKLRFINFYANYGVGNPLNIISTDNNPLEGFIRYFKKGIDLNSSVALMSNDDFTVAGKLLRKIGIKVKEVEGFDALKMQAYIVQCLTEYQNEILIWFGENDLAKITEEQLLQQRYNLEKLLNFPKKISRKIVLDDDAISNIINKANSNVKFRNKVAGLIKDYSEKLAQVEITGEPMRITKEDMITEYVFGTEDNLMMPNSVIELVRNEGAKVYETE